MVTACEELRAGVAREGALQGGLCTSSAAPSPAELRLPGLCIPDHLADGQSWKMGPFPTALLHFELFLLAPWL